MNNNNQERNNLLKSNLDKLIKIVGIDNVSEYILNDNSITDIERTSLLFLVENKLAYKDI